MARNEKVTFRRLEKSWESKSEGRKKKKKTSIWVAAKRGRKF